MGVVIRRSTSKDSLELSGREGGRSELLEDSTVFLVFVLLPPNRAPYRTGAQKVYGRSESVQHVQRMARSLGWLSHMVLGKTWG